MKKAKAYPLGEPITRTGISNLWCPLCGSYGAPVAICLPGADPSRHDRRKVLRDWLACPHCGLVNQEGVRDYELAADRTEEFWP